jgi:thiamine kinase-like enzyme
LPKAIAHLGGNTLVHFDIRADNIVLGNDGRVSFVDWPWACRGAIWMDITLFLVNAALIRRRTRTGIHCWPTSIRGT